jgi:hypothetical protein
MPLAISGRGKRRTYYVDYTKVAWEESSDNIPMLPVILSWGNRTLKTKMLLDTGAGVCFILPWMARHLHLKMEEGEGFAPGAGGQIRVQASKLNLQPAVRDTDGRPARPRLIEHVLIPAEEDSLPFPMLGRHPFFWWYDIELREMDEQFILRERRNGR